MENKEVKVEKVDEKKIDYKESLDKIFQELKELKEQKNKKEKQEVEKIVIKKNDEINVLPKVDPVSALNKSIFGGNN